MLNIAVRAARRAGDVINRSRERLDAIEVHRKGRQDYVSEVDIQAERAIIDTLTQAYPDHGILAEESGSSDAVDEKECIWIIDPLDGTMNYLHGYPQFAVSIALQVKGVLDQAVIFDPTRNELFTASRGEGAQLDGKRIRVSKIERLDQALIGTGFPIRSEKKIEPYLRSFEKIIYETAGIRRAGAAALDLAYVACGRLDGFWEVGLAPWDIAAGALIIQEAGGIVSDIDGSQGFLDSGNVIGGTARVHASLSQIVSG